jgi:CDP-glucose 4,6-dehydratase
MHKVAPEVVIHMAAQPLVRESYANPVETFSTNVMGTVNLMESIRTTPSVEAVVVITSDKCYENKEWLWPYREIDPLGGRDPYSASKGITEIAVASYRDSFLSDAGVRVATARAGNVIGGGDWSSDRLVPDCFRALESGIPLKIRSSNAVRPWQHVLDPLAGYIRLAELLHTRGSEFAGPWNFGPNESSHKPVSWLVEHMRSQMTQLSWEIDLATVVHESRLLTLDSSKARSALGWEPRWDLERSLGQTLRWHKAWASEADMSKISTQQIEEYTSL